MNPNRPMSDDDWDPDYEDWIEEDDAGEPTGSCDECGVNVYDGDELCDQCAYWAYRDEGGTIP